MSTDGTHPDIPDQQWSNPFKEDTPLHGLYERRVSQNSDLVIVVSDYHNRRGTGKTVLSLKLAAGMDRTEEGITEEKVSTSPEEIREAFAEQPQGSALVLDEAEAELSSRRSMSNINEEMKKIVSIGRVTEKYLILNAPASSHIDKAMKELADVWMLVQRRGRALVHFFEYVPYAQKPVTPKKQSFEWSDIETGTQLHSVYQSLTRDKYTRIDGNESGFVTEEDHKEAVEQAQKSARRETRDEIIAAVYNHPETEISQRVLADAVGVHFSRVGQIAREADQ